MEMQKCACDLHSEPNPYMIIMMIQTIRLRWQCLKETHENSALKTSKTGLPCFKQ